MAWLETFFADRDDYSLFLARTGHVLVVWAWVLTGIIWTLGFLAVATDWLPRRVENAAAVFDIGAMLFTFLVFRLIIWEKNRLHHTS